MLQPPLVQAIFNRNAEEVKLLLHKKEDVNALVCIITFLCKKGPDHAGPGPQYYEFKHENKTLDCIFFLIPQDQERRTPLHAAACVGDVHIMDLLIESGE